MKNIVPFLRKYGLSIVISLFLYSCNPLPSELNGIDLNKWKEDKYACENYRKEKINDLHSSKETLLRFSEADIMSILGRPESTELIEKSQKIYTYYLEPNKNCGVSNIGTIKILQVRFNSTGYCNSLIIMDKAN